MKKGCALLLVMLLSVAGCGKKKKCAENCVSTTDKETTVSMPVSQEPKELQSVFDDDIAEFALVDETQADANAPKAESVAKDQEKAVDEDMNNEFSWIDDENQHEQDLKTVYFDFDKYAIKQDQEAVVDHNVDILKKTLVEADNSGKKVTVVIEGHACHSAGSASYNLALSEKRAKVLKDRLVQAGIPNDKIKIVGRGQECPVIGKDGKAVTGTREQQWPNRRDDINILNA